MIEERMLHVRRELAERGYPIERWGEVPAELWVELGFSEPLNFGERPPQPPDCATCHDEGWVIVATPGHPLDGRTIGCPRCERGRANAQSAYTRAFISSGLPEHYQTCTFASFDALPPRLTANKRLAYGAALLFAERRDHHFCLGDIYQRFGEKVPKYDSDPVRNSLVLYGEYGTGKTGLAAAIANYCMATDVILYIRVQDLLRAVQKTYDRDYKGESRDALVFRIKTAPLLIIDEFGMLTISNDRNEIMEEVIRFRCNHDLPFVATTNDAPDVFKAKWDGRIVEVMLEAAHWIPVDPPMLRDQAQPEAGYTQEAQS